MTIEPSQSRYRPVWQMLKEFYERYRRPIFIAETGIEDTARPAWLRYVSHEVRRAMRTGVPVQGICLYPILNHPGWEDDRHCFNGLWDYADEQGEREVYEPLAKELAAQQQLIADLPRMESFEESEEDKHLLDVAAHWMEIRSGHESIINKDVV
jgi:hypothetical protein